MSDAEYFVFMTKGESTYKCASSIKALCTLTDEDTIWKLPKMVVSPRRELILPNKGFHVSSYPSQDYIA
jgi:hypothetical protein